MSDTYSLSPLELRLEISKYLGNIRFDLLKRIYDGQAILEGYEKGNVSIHVHLSPTTLNLSVDNKSAKSFGRVCGVYSCRSVQPRSMRGNNEVTVFVGVGVGSERFRPVDSVVRLQSLDSCRMSIIDELEEALAPSPETLLRILYGELCSVLIAAGIERGEFINKVIKRSPQIVEHFSNKNRNVRRDRVLRPMVLQNVHLFAGRDEFAKLRLHLNGSLGGFYLPVDNFSMEDFKLSKAFCCPVEPDISIIERRSCFLRHSDYLEA
jgi:hypothetical protein